jgi:hypothetical protein
MSTRSNTAILNSNGTVTMTYCHFDGYPSHRAPILLANYSDEDDVRALIALGDMSSQGERHIPFGPHSYERPEEGCSVFYCRDRGEAWDDVKPMEYASVDDAVAAMSAYLYLFVPGEGWSYNEYGRGFRPISSWEDEVTP